MYITNKIFSGDSPECKRPMRAYVKEQFYVNVKRCDPLACHVANDKLKLMGIDEVSIQSIGPRLLYFGSKNKGKKFFMVARIIIYTVSCFSQPIYNTSENPLWKKVLRLRDETQQHNVD